MARVGRAVLIGVVVACAGSTTACSSPTPLATTITVTHAWARPTPTGASNGVAYLAIASPADDEIIGAAVPASVATRVELHESMGGGAGAAMPNMPDMASATGEMTMVPLERVALPAHRKVEFAPGAKHVMLTGLATPLVAGSHFVLTLRFAHAAPMDVSVEVRDNAP
jgi:copper(I)-binding protein